MVPSEIIKSKNIYLTTLWTELFVDSMSSSPIYGTEIIEGLESDGLKDHSGRTTWF